ncbi:MAG TPA: rod shape-determining protein RodA [Bacteroidales bacterium]|nr:rod shape-determining protein RodA [Bacteroidales bacterium]
MKRRSNNIARWLDWPVVIIFLTLLLMGWLNIYAAVFSEEHTSIFDTSQQYGMQLIWIIATLLIAIVILTIDSRFYVVFANFFYFIVLGVLVFVIFFGVEVNASKSWIQLGGLRIQPAEFAKFATSLALAKYMSSYGFKLGSLKSYIKTSLIVLAPVVLILLQNDAGSAMVFTAFVWVFYSEGMPHWVLAFIGFMITLFLLVLILNKYIILLGLVLLTLILFALISKDYKNAVRFSIGLFGLTAVLYGVSEFFDLSISPYYLILIPIAISIPAVIIYTYLNKARHVLVLLLFFITASTFSFSVNYIFNNVLAIHHRDRINDLLGIETDPLGWGYNVNQSKIAIGSGGLTGKGFLKGTQTKYNFVPEQSTDFIFCTVGEEWGFVGSVVVIGLFLALLLRLIVLAERQKEAFARIYGYGVVSILFFHITVNLAMTIGLFPVIGIPLPFFSYGGSSLWSFTILLFIFLKLDSSRLD